ncbi:MAG: hypothetical protein H0S79_12820 [Anaerolineaceae bacterium]|nr:hypothetical protein [Anaerolineaceae bacterium]
MTKAMHNLTLKLVEVFQLGDEVAGVLDLPPSAWPEPGQYLPAQRFSGEQQVLTTPLFRVSDDTDRLCVGPLPQGWVPGDRLDILSPHGRGFQLPPSASRIGLVVLGVSPSRLLPLIPSALDKGASVALFSDLQLSLDLRKRIPSAIEIAPLTTLTHDLTWPDFLAVDLSMESLPQLRGLLGVERLLFEGQVLIRTAMPCHSVGKCGVCSVETSKGWRLACEDGPVFPLAEVLHVAG